MAAEAPVARVRVHVVMLSCKLSWAGADPLTMSLPLTMLAEPGNPKGQLCRPNVTTAHPVMTSGDEPGDSTTSSSMDTTSKSAVRSDNSPADAMAVMDLAYRVAAVDLRDPASAGDTSGPFQVSTVGLGQPVNLDPPYGDVLRVQNLLLEGLAQGPEAATAADLAHPQVWTILMWGISR